MHSSTKQVQVVTVRYNNHQTGHKNNIFILWPDTSKEGFKIQKELNKQKYWSTEIFSSWMKYTVNFEVSKTSILSLVWGGSYVWLAFNLLVLRTWGWYEANLCRWYVVDMNNSHLQTKPTEFIWLLEMFKSKPRKSRNRLYNKHVQLIQLV